MKKILFFGLWISSLAFVVFSVLKITPLDYVLSDTARTINFLQRLSGLLALVLLFWQIILGAFMPRWTEKLGGWVFKFHLFEGGLAYSLVLLHPLLFVLFRYKSLGILDPFYVFTDLCVLCSNKLEFYYNLGRVGFWLVTTAVIAAKFRTKPWLKIHWRKLHILNYLAFTFISFHSKSVGTDVGFSPFSQINLMALLIIIFLGTYKLVRLIPFLRK